MTKIKKTPLFETHQKLGAKMISFAGFEMPVRYSSDIEEHIAVRQAAGLFDISHMGEFLVKGENALSFIQKVSANDASKLEDGQAQYSYLPNSKGGVIDDLLVYRLNEKKYMLVVNASNIQKDWNWINQFPLEQVCLENVSDETCLLALQGPKAIDCLKKLTKEDLDSIPYYHFTIGEIAKIKNVIISNTGYTGSGGFELYTKNENIVQLWNKLMKAGEGLGLKPTGLSARDTLRLEKGFCLYGNELSEETSPLQAGLGWVTKFNKNFVGKEALLKEKEKGVMKHLVAIKVMGKGIPRPGYIVTKDARQIGKVTSGSMSPQLKVGIALAMVESGIKETGTQVVIQGKNRALNAQIVKLPFV